MTSHGYTITGDNYFFLNFYQLPVVDMDKASGEGTNESFPVFFASQYMFFHYLQMCRVLHKNAALMKARSIGFSEINASLAARLYTTIKRSRTVITCFNDTYLNGTFSKLDHALTFINTNADGFFKPRIKDTQFEIKSGYQTKVDGQFVDAGWQSVVIGILADKPSKIRGDRVDLLIYDLKNRNILLIESYKGSHLSSSAIAEGKVLRSNIGYKRSMSVYYNEFYAIIISIKT